MGGPRGVVVGFPRDDAPRVAIATPYYDSVCPDTEDCLRQLEIASAKEGIPCYRVRAQGTIIQRTRNDLAYKVRQMELDQRPSHILWVDADQIFHELSLVRLLGWGVPIVGGLYRKREEEGGLVVGRRNKHGIWETSNLWAEMLSAASNGDFLFENLDHAGFGFMLTDIRVFDRLERPWFRVDPEPDVEMGEDVYFCMKAKEAGISVAVDIGCEVGHIGKKIYEVDDFWRRFERWQQERSEINEPAAAAG